MTAAVRARVGANGLLAVRVTPGARTDAVVVGADDAAVQVRVAARAIDGAANDAVLRLLAATLGCAPGRLSLQRGARSRDKLVRVAP